MHEVSYKKDLISHRLTTPASGHKDRPSGLAHYDESRGSSLMNFDADAFISYAHMDNVELIEGQKGWVANLHRALEVRVGQLLGKQPHIWRDPKLQGNDL